MAHYWQIREHWQRTDGRGWPRELWLLDIDEAFVKGWRVEWPGSLRRNGESFTGLAYDAGFETQARQFLADKMLEAGGEWKQVD
jgi:hypothetical protein